MILEPDDDSPDPIVLDYPDLFCDIADALHASGYSEQALHFYEPLHDNCSKYMTLKNYIGMYTSYKSTERTEQMKALLPALEMWDPDSLEDLAVLAKFFEDNDMKEEAWSRGELVYKNGGGRLLQKIGFRGYHALQEHFFNLRKKARGKHGVRKARVRKYMKALRAATQGGADSADEEEGERPSLGPRTKRPRNGLFRSKRLLQDSRPSAFLPDEIPGTNVPNDAINEVFFRQRLNTIASESQDELKAARAQHREIVASFQRLDELSELAEKGVEESILEWISVARELIEEFSTFDLFYCDKKHGFTSYFRRATSGDFWKESVLMVLAVVANGVEDGKAEPELKQRPEKIPEDFWGVHFDKWFDTFIQYALFLARRGDDERCFSTIEVAIQSNIFYKSERYLHHLQLCRLACAIGLDDSMQGSSAIRFFMRTYSFGSDLFRLYAGFNRMCSVANGYATGPSLKVLMRYVKTMDYALLTPEQRETYNFRGTDDPNWMAKAVNTESVRNVKDHDPAVFALYAHVLMCGGSYVAALNYYFRAFTITPDDPLLSLCIGVAYIQHAMKRLSENRQFQLQQGLSFIYRYYELRTKDNIAVHCSEAEFNMGRVWHSLGLLSQAIPAYERCIELSERVQEEGKGDSQAENEGIEDFATEAAFAIQSIYALSGNLEGARRVTEQVLIIE